MTFKEIAWDFDGTLYCSYPRIIRCLRLAMEQFGVTDSEENIARYAHITVGHAWEHYAPLCGCSPQELAQWYRHFNQEVSDIVVPYQGIPELLRDIVAAGGRNHICSNRSAKGCLDYLERDGLASYFDVFSGASPDVKTKPAPDLIQVILDARSLLPTALLMVGDRNLDIEAAHAAGAKGCFFDPDGFSTPTCDPEFIASDIGQLRSILLH